MADIKTILRELSVILGYILAKYKLKFAEDFIDVKKYLEFIRKYCSNINECNSEIKKIEELDDLVIHKDIIKNGLKLGKLLFDKLNLEGDISWTGSKVKSKYPFDIQIGETGISVKEDSYILKNPSFSNYLNDLIQPVQPYKNIHIFREFAPKELKLWFEYTYGKLFEEFSKKKPNASIFNYPKRGNFIKKGTKGLIFGDREKEIEIGIDEKLDEKFFNSRLGGDIFEHTVSKWIKHNLEKHNHEYIKLKKNCSMKAGENLREFINKNLNLNREKLLELFQIYDKNYYYGKSFGEVQLYQVPKNTEVDVLLKNIDIKVPKSQLNVYFTFLFSNKNGSSIMIFRVESRYSHGQFKGIPEAKLYYTDTINHLKNLYKVI